MLDEQHQSMYQDQDMLRQEIRRAGFKVVTKHLRRGLYAVWLYAGNMEVFNAIRGSERHAVRVAYWRACELEAQRRGAS